MRVDELAYELPPALIAQRPAERREEARLLSLPRHGGAPENRRVADLPELLPPGALVVLNDTRVVPARLLGRKPATGGAVEVLLVRSAGIRSVEGQAGEVRPAAIWHALGKGVTGLPFGTAIEVRAVGASEVGPPRLLVRPLGRLDDGLLEVVLWTPSGEPIDAALRACGHVPLPPYIKREDGASDVERYQTVYARCDGAIAAPTAGLHLTEDLLRRLVQRGCELTQLTLHVGLGTFQPVTVDDLDEHPMHSERFEVPAETSEAVARARRRGAPVVAVGTTSVRALESAADPEQPGHVRATTGETRLLIQPGYSWRVTDGLLTNFHMPRSTLLALVCAFGGATRVLDAYRLAVREQYRFFSYGDAMLLWRAT